MITSRLRSSVVVVAATLAGSAGMVAQEPDAAVDWTDGAVCYEIFVAGRYDATSLLDGTAGVTLEVTESGRIADYVPVASLNPLQSYLFTLTRSGSIP